MTIPLGVSALVGRATADTQPIPSPADASYWLKLLRPYREPRLARSMAELAITAVPFLALWLLMWLSLGYAYWLCLLLSVPAAGFLVRLFMIQHDCGHGSFFRRRRANDWVGRVIGVLTLTPYGYLAAYPCHPSRQLRQSRPARHRRHRHADGARVSSAVALAPAALSPVAPPAGHVRRGPGLSLRPAAPPAGRADAVGWRPGSAPCRPTWPSLLVVGVADWLVGVGALPADTRCRSPARGVGRRLAVLRPAPVRRRALGAGCRLERPQAALHGSSHYICPAVLRWFTANIGVHHVHHL